MVCSFGFRDDSKTGRNQLMCSLKQLYCYLWFPDHKKNGLPLTEQLGGGAACMHLELSGQLQLRKHLCAQGASCCSQITLTPSLERGLALAQKTY